MKPKLGIIIFAFTEVLIGSITLFAVTLSIMQGKSSKPLEVLVFVSASAILSVVLGLGILRFNLTCYRFLLYFSSVIIFSKILIFAKVITLSGSVETSIPADLKNVVSILYHSLLIFYLTCRRAKRLFNKVA